MKYPENNKHLVLRETVVYIPRQSKPIKYYLNHNERNNEKKTFKLQTSNNTKMYLLRTLKNNKNKKGDKN